MVLDTNILISACWKLGGLEQRVLELGLSGKFEIAATTEVMAEYCEVLGRPKFSQHADRIRELFSRLKPTLVEGGPRLQEALDEDDNHILECAVAARASYIVTGNLKDFPPEWEKARIVNARQFLIENDWL